MDDEKSITEKLTDAITRATDTVKSTMSNIVDTASQAAQHAMESNAERMPGQRAPGRIATTANEHVYIPLVADAAAMPAPLVAVQPTPKKRAPRTKLSSGKMPPANKPVAKTANKKAGKKAAKKAAKKSAPKRSKRGASKNTAKKSAKKSAKKTTNKKARKKARKNTKNKSKR